MIGKADGKFRRVWNAPPPPHDPPDPSALWDEWFELWFESDAAFLARIRESL